MAPVEMYTTFSNQQTEKQIVLTGQFVDKRIKDITIHVEGKENGAVFEIKQDSQQKPKIHEIHPGEKFKIKKTVIEKGGKKETFTLKFTGK